MSLIEFNFEKKSEYYTDPKIRKWRTVGKILDIIGFILIGGSLLIFWNEFEKMETGGLEMFLHPPFPFIIAGIIFFILGTIVIKIAMLKSVVKSFKTNDNPFFKEKEKITNEINEKKKEFDDLKNAINEMNNNKDE